MANINKVIIAGRLTKDPELRYTNIGIPIVQLSMAINEKVKRNDEWTDEVLYVNRISVWGKSAENAAEYLLKGSQVLIEGRLKNNTWETDSGEKRSNLDITATRVHYLSTKQKDSQGDVFDKNDNEDLTPMKDENIPF